MAFDSPASPSARHRATGATGPSLPNTSQRTKNLLTDQVSHASAGRHLQSSHDIHIEEDNRRRERDGWEFERLKGVETRHRTASTGSINRLNSWATPSSGTQKDWETKKRAKDAQTKKKARQQWEKDRAHGNISSVEAIERKRINAANKDKMKEHDSNKQQTQKLLGLHRAGGLQGMKDYQHDDGLHMRRAGIATTRKTIDESNWHHDAASGRTAATRRELLRSAIVQPSAVEHASTHRKHGHLNDDEMQDYCGLKQGEELDEEGRVIPPWAVQEMRAARYMGPMGEDYTKYNADYPAVDMEAVTSWSARPPPPQMYLKDERGKNVRRSDPRHPHQPETYGQPMVGPYARFYESPAAVAVEASHAYGPGFGGAYGGGPMALEAGYGYPYGPAAGYGEGPGAEFGYY